jgi:hypothetical protein
MTPFDDVSHRMGVGLHHKDTTRRSQAGAGDREKVVRSARVSSPAHPSQRPPSEDARASGQWRPINDGNASGEIRSLLGVPTITICSTSLSHQAPEVRQSVAAARVTIMAGTDRSARAGVAPGDFSTNAQRNLPPVAFPCGRRLGGLNRQPIGWHGFCGARESKGEPFGAIRRR